jgi:DNA topoisomerase-1
VATAALAIGRPPASETEAEKQILASYDVAAEVLGNTRTVCRNCYVHPVVPEAYRTGRLHEEWKRSRPSRTLDRKERTVLKLLEADDRHD